MGLSTSLFAGISGLERHQQRLDVIGNNLANVNTYGFKGQRVLFQDLLYSTIKPGTAPDAEDGGSNPSQIGYGVALGVVDTNFNQGSFETTGIDSDVAIDGNGFFVLQSGSVQRYTRDGAFSINQERKLVNPTNGMYVQGWNQVKDNTGKSSVNTGGALQDVIIPVGDDRRARATSEVIFNGNLNNGGAASTTGTILNSQRLFTSSSGETEVTSGAVDIRDVYIKDPAGGVNNVRLFKGTGSSGTDNTVLQSGDKITVQLMKGGRSLEAIFTYGIRDLVNNMSGDLGPDGVPDPGTEHYDGTTLNDFTKWFDYSFGLTSLEDTGASPDANAAHGVDGDNPNDVVDMGKGGANPFKDETDGAGFSLVLSARGATGLSGNTALATPTVPKAAIENSIRQYNIKAGSAADVGIGNSFVDIDGDGAFIRGKDIVLEGVQSYVVTGNSTVTKGSVPFGSTALNLVLRPFDAIGAAAPVNGADMYIDVGDNGVYDKGVDIVIKGAFSTNVLGATTAVTAAPSTDGNGRMVITHAGTNLGISKGMFFRDLTNAVTYTVMSVSETTAGNTEVTLDKANDAAGLIANGNALTYQGAALVKAGYTATSSTAAGSTLVADLNVPVAIQHPTSGLYVGKTFYSTMVDNEKGVAGSQFVEGDASVKVLKAPARITTGAAAGANAITGFMTLTISAGTLAADVAKLQTGMTIVGASGTVYTVEKINSTTGVITFNKANANAVTDFTAGGTFDFNGLCFIDADNDGVLKETVYRVRNDLQDAAGASSGKLFIDLSGDGTFTNATDLTVKSSTTILDLSSYADNEVVYTDTATGYVYRKVPVQYDITSKTVYLDRLNKGTYDEVMFNIVNSGSATTSTARWVLDEDNDGRSNANGSTNVDSNETTVISTKDITATLTGESATINLPTATSIDGVRTGSGRIQIRGNIGSVNEMSQVSFISGTDKTERTIFQDSALTSGTDNAASRQKGADGESVVQNIVVYDSTGRAHDIAMTFVLDRKDNDKAVWRWFAECADATQKTGYYPATDPRGKAPGINVGTGTVIFDNFGKFLRTEPSPALLSIPLEGLNADSALTIRPDFKILTGFANSSGSQVDVREQDGYAQGVMDSYSIDANGKVIGIYTNGLRETVAQIALAAFANPDGLSREGANLWAVNANSGNAMIGEAMTGERGALRSKTLEQSNVDITAEFTNMIVTQRAYQANSRVITKSDELLQELLQILR